LIPRGVIGDFKKPDVNKEAEEGDSNIS